MILTIQVEIFLKPKNAHILLYDFATKLVILTARGQTDLGLLQVGGQAGPHVR